jgi:hypothetical protein
MDILILYCHNIVDFISYYHNTRKGILYGMYCNILLYCHIIRNTEFTHYAQLYRKCHSAAILNGHFPHNYHSVAFPGVFYHLCHSLKPEA